ncbi:MAG: aminoglycoside phosphotransferase family protein [Mycobacteriaceae bacterium]
MHSDELVVTADTVRSLIDSQLPHLAGLPLARLPVSGSSNVLFRLGDELLVRLPRQPGGSTIIAKEAKYLPLIASSVRVLLPEVVALGAPGVGYPECWSVVRWIDGQLPAVPVPPSPQATLLALDLAEVVGGLRSAVVPVAALGDSTLRSYRARSVRAVDTDVRQYLSDCRAVPDLPLDLDACERVWTDAVNVPEPPSDRPASWVHGDLLAENLLLHEGRLAAVLDFGALAVGEPSVDLVGAWELLGAEDRAVFRDALGIDDAEWARGRAWALAIAVMTFPYYWRTMPQRCADRLVMARAVLSDHLS